jgi:Na+/H+ antiporter NhaD/arsenite permease-like protein
LDNVTIVILVAPVTLFIAASMKVSPIPFLIAEILASNIGGAATLIGDPPNILIGSAAGLDFLTFALNMAPVALFILIVFVGLSWFLFRKELGTGGSISTDLVALDASTLVTDRRLLAKGVVVLGLVVFGFMIHGALHLEPATIAMAGATVLLVWTSSDVDHTLREVEWTTLFFFIGLFITVEALIQVGIIESVSKGLIEFTGGDLVKTSMLVLWMSSIASGIVDNIPYTATMIPIIENLGLSMPIMPLWWSLALGACLGGNATLVGASANVVVANLADRSGSPISFGLFLRYGLVTTFISLIIASLYVWFRYL